MNTTLILILRTICIFAVVLWVGSAVVYLFLVKPSVKAIGPDAPKFIKVGRQRYPIYMGIVGLLTVLAGVPLFWNASGGLKINWIRADSGIGFMIGSLISIGVFFLGKLMLNPRGEQVSAPGQEIDMSGGHPTPEQASKMENLERELWYIWRTSQPRTSI